jgi:hypothetical protein
VKPEDLNAAQRKQFGVWRELGLSEEAALDALREDGWLSSSPVESWEQRMFALLDDMDARLQQIQEAQVRRGER